MIMLSNMISKRDIEVHAHYQYAPRCVSFKALMGCKEAIKCEVLSDLMISVHPTGALNSTKQGVYCLPKNCSKCSY